MTASTQYNYGRRNSNATTPYTLPSKHQSSHQQPGHHSPIQSSYQLYHHHHNNYNPNSRQPPQQQTQQVQSTSPPLSATVPTLSREFVVRRISEGETGRLKEELRCEACGKGYKHISSLAKHLWEHTPEWNVTKKLLISKHQQVQLLEAASILVGMNENSSYANGGGYAGYSTMGVSSEQEGYNGGHLAGPYSPPITSNDSTPVIQDVREAVEDDDDDEDDDDEEEGEGVGYYDQERGNGKMSMSFRNELRHEQYEDDEYDHKGLNYARSGSVSHEPPTYAKNEPTSPLLAATKEEDEEKENKNEKSLKSPDLSYLNNPSELPIKTNFSIIESKHN